MSDAVLWKFSKTTETVIAATTREQAIAAYRANTYYILDDPGNSVSPDVVQISTEYDRRRQDQDS